MTAKHEKPSEEEKKCLHNQGKLFAWDGAYCCKACNKTFSEKEWFVELNEINDHLLLSTFELKADHAIALGNIIGLNARIAELETSLALAHEQGKEAMELTKANRAANAIIGQQADEMTKIEAERDSARCQVVEFRDALERTVAAHRIGGGTAEWADSVLAKTTADYAHLTTVPREELESLRKDGERKEVAWRVISRLLKDHPTEHIVCLDCGEPMRHNVPRMGDAGGFVHAATSSLQCAARATDAGRKDINL